MNTRRIQVNGVPFGKTKQIDTEPAAILLCLSPDRHPDPPVNLSFALFPEGKVC